MPMTKLDEANFNAHLDRHIPRVHTASLGLHKVLGLLEPAIPFPPPPPPPIPPTLHPKQPEPIDPTTSSATSKATFTARPPSPQHPGNSYPWWTPRLSSTLQTWSTLLAPSAHHTTALSISFWTLAPHPPRRLASLTRETARSIQLFSVDIPAHASAPASRRLSGRWLCIQMIEPPDTTDCCPWNLLAFPASIATRRHEYMLTPRGDRVPGVQMQGCESGGAPHGAPYVCCTELDVDGGGMMPLVDGGGVDPLAWGTWMEAVAMGRGRIVVCVEAGRRLFEW